MVGIALVFLAAVFGEAGISIGKHEVETKKESMYSLGFLNLFWGTAFFTLYALAVPGAFVFDMASLPTFSVRALLEMLVAFLSVHAISFADRSTYGFLRILTLPLLLLVDLGLGYVLSIAQLLGIAIIVLSLILLFINHGIRKRGAWYVIAMALLAVVTISLYKYDITHYNSVAAEQMLVSLIDMIFLYSMARIVAHENPFRLLRKPAMFVQSFSSGVGQVVMSFAYVFAPASVISAANRSFTSFAALISGDMYFKEKHILVKGIAFAFMTVGVILLAF